MLDLVQKVIKSEGVGRDLLGHFARRLLVELLLGTLHQRNDIAHAEDAVGHTFGVEHVKCLHFFTRTDEFDGDFYHTPNRQGGTTAGIAI